MASRDAFAAYSMGQNARTACGARQSVARAMARGGGVIEFIFHPDVFGLGAFVAFCAKGFEFGITIFFWSLQRDLSRRQER